MAENNVRVTYDDRHVIEGLRRGEFRDGWHDLVRRLADAAEAERPRLREGWALYEEPDGSYRVFWHGADDGTLSLYDDGTVTYPMTPEHRNRLTSVHLLPADLSPEDIDAAASSARAAYLGMPEAWWDRLTADARDDWRRAVRAVLDRLTERAL